MIAPLVDSLRVITLIETRSLFLAQSRDVYQWVRLEQLDQWWHWLLLGLIVLLVVAHVVQWYKWDGLQLPAPVRWALLWLRLVALIGILLYFFQLDKRTEQRIVRPSRVAVLVDTSLSMTAPGTPSPSGVPASVNRSEEMAEMLTQSPLLKQLTDGHQVTVYRFDQAQRPTALVALDRQSATADDVANESVADSSRRPIWISLTAARWLVLASTALGVVAALSIALALLAHALGASQWRPGPWMLLAGSCLAPIALVLGAWGVVPNSQYTLASLWSLAAPKNVTADTTSAVRGTDSPTAQSASGNDQPGLTPAATTAIDWSTVLQPVGVESRIGDSLRWILDHETGNPLAGIILVTDGRSNAGVDPRAVVPAAQTARVPLYIIGVGSDQRPANLQLVELDMPRRLYPGDRFSVSALIDSVGFQGQFVQVQFLSGRKQDDIQAMQIETEATAQIPTDGSLVTVSVELSPKAVGQWKYMARITPLPGEAHPDDNAALAEAEVIERQNRVLIIAGGPLREYQFVRNLLYRDQDVQSHVLLQSGDSGTSQEAQQILSEFPADRGALSQYDAILALDADWTRVPEAALQAMEKWVAEQAGGLLMVAGSVETPKWLARSASGTRSQILRDLSPVILDVRGSALLAAGRVEGESTWPLLISPDGRQTEFLWLTDEPTSSLELWQSFSGVHTFYSAYQLKPGAKALAYFSDPTSAAGGQQPIYLASQFYGAGRVVFQGGSEMWRLRSLGDQYFDRYYTKLVRWISQGRLLLDSDRGVLLMDREEAVQGEQVSVRAVLKNERYEPLVQSEVVARLVDPQGLNIPLVLRPLADGSQPGVYSGQFPVLSVGTYRIQLQLGGLSSNEILRTQLQARVPKLELQNAQRHDALLSQLANDTGGRYWPGVAAAIQPIENGQLDLVAAIASQDQVAYSPGVSEREFQLRWLGWLMSLIASSLSLEWLSRRVYRLA
ncbi:MAG: VWA domain-containing protein [Pirellulaceae bacterium]|nr:VWA domain-containing protein [Pirellulaceae bacterium]